MSLRTQYEFLFVGRDEGNFVENYAYDLGEGSEASGKVFINLEIQNNPADAELIGENIFDVMRKVFFDDLEKDPYARFEEAVKAVNRALADFKAERNTKYLGNLNILIAAVVGKDIFVTQAGEAEAYLIRRRLCSNISEGLADENSLDVFSNIANGTLESGDVVLLTCTRLVRYIGKTDIAKVFSGKNLVVSLGELKDFLSTEVLSKVAMIAIGARDLNQAAEDTIESSPHLQKEEYGPTSKKSAKDLVGVLKNIAANFSSVANDLIKRVSNSVNKGKRGAGAPLSNNGRMAEMIKVGNLSRNQLIAALIVIVLVFGGGFLWLKNRFSEQQEIEKSTQILNEVHEQISSAETTGQYNKDQAGEILSQAEQKALQVLNSGYNRAKATELLQNIADTRDRLDGVLHPQVKVVADLATKRQNVSAVGLLALKGTLYAYEYNALYPLVLDKLGDPLTIDENESVISGTSYDDQGSLIFFTKSGKVIEYKDGRFVFVDTADPAFHKGIAIQGYSNKIYVLDPEGNQIWRYTRRRDKFDMAAAYNINADLKNAVSLAIDGNVYVLNKDGSMIKLFGGNKEDFPVKKQPVKPPTSPTRVFTQLDMGAIYVLEPAAKRVLVYYKDDKTHGVNYTNQYIFDDLTDIRDIYFDKDANKLYLLDASKIYEVVFN